MKITAAEFPQNYADLRRDAYPSAGEQLGALVKAVAALKDILPPGAIPPDAQAVFDEVADVKARLEKPE